MYPFNYGCRDEVARLYRTFTLRRELRCVRNSRLSARVPGPDMDDQDSGYRGLEYWIRGDCAPL